MVLKLARRTLEMRRWDVPSTFQTNPTYPVFTGTKFSSSEGEDLCLWVSGEDDRTLGVASGILWPLRQDPSPGVCYEVNRILVAASGFSYLRGELSSMGSSQGWQQLGCCFRISLITEVAFWSADSVHGLEGLGGAPGFHFS